MASIAVICILQTLCDCAGDSNVDRDKIKTMTSVLLDCLQLQFSEDKFNEICVSTNIDLRSYVKYITGIIKDVTKPNLTKLENTCWELCQEMYFSPSLLCGEIKSLWSIFMRLADDETCPPTLTNQNYFIIYSLFDLSFTQREKQPSIDFRRFLNFFQHSPNTKLHKPSIEQLHDVIVNNIKAGWLEIRCNRNRKITSFKQLWCSFKDKSLNFYKFEKSNVVHECRICISENVKKNLIYDKHSQADSLILTIECGIKYKLKSCNNSLQDWFDILHLYNHKSSPRTKITQESYKSDQFSLPKLVNETSLRKKLEPSNSEDIKLPTIHNHQPFVLETNRNKTSFPCTERWEGFTNFKRTNKDGKTVMISRSRILGDIEPGIHNLRDLMPIIGLPSLKPKHTVVKNIKWISKELPESTHSSGKLIFPPSFDEHIVTENATSEFLAYYGCRFADMSFETVTLPFRHCIQDFNYKKDYLEEFVLNSGAGIEKHNFLHLDCPLEDDSGFFILGEIYNEDEIHLTAFKIPLRHTLYVPRGCIHSNDYLKGTWRTMLSDESDVDHVFLVKNQKTMFINFISNLNKTA